MPSQCDDRHRTTEKLRYLVDSIERLGAFSTASYFFHFALFHAEERGSNFPLEKQAEYPSAIPEPMCKTRDAIQLPISLVPCTTLCQTSL